MLSSVDGPSLTGQSGDESVRELFLDDINDWLESRIWNYWISIQLFNKLQFLRASFTPGTAPFKFSWVLLFNFWYWARTLMARWVTILRTSFNKLRDLGLNSDLIPLAANSPYFQLCPTDWAKSWLRAGLLRWKDSTSDGASNWTVKRISNYRFSERLTSGCLTIILIAPDA